MSAWTNWYYCLNWKRGRTHMKYLHSHSFIKQSYIVIVQDFACNSYYFRFKKFNFYLNFKLSRKIELQSNLLKFPKSWLLHFIIINKFICKRDHYIAKGENMEIIDKIKFDFCYFSNEIYTKTLEQNWTRKRESTAYTIYLEMNVKKKKEDKSLHDSFLPQPKLYW